MSKNEDIDWSQFSERAVDYVMQLNEAEWDILNELKKHAVPSPVEFLRTISNKLEKAYDKVREEGEQEEIPAPAEEKIVEHLPAIPPPPPLPRPVGHKKSGRKPRVEQPVLEPSLKDFVPTPLPIKQSVPEPLKVTEDREEEDDVPEVEIESDPPPPHLPPPPPQKPKAAIPHEDWRARIRAFLTRRQASLPMLIHELGLKDIEAQRNLYKLLEEMRRKGEVKPCTFDSSRWELVAARATG